MATETVQYGGVLTGSTPEAAAKQAAQVAQLGLTQCKLKFGPQRATNLEMLRAVQEVLGPTVALRADANACWSVAEALAQIPVLYQAGIAWFEQPLPASPRADYPALVAQLPPGPEIIVDESLLSLADAQWMRQHAGAHRLQLKISKVGGLLPALAIGRWAQAQGMPIHLGCHVGESSLLSAAGRLFAACIPCDSVEGSYGTYLLQEDVTEQPLMFGAGGTAPARYSPLPGWGLAWREAWR